MSSGEEEKIASTPSPAPATEDYGSNGSPNYHNIELSRWQRFKDSFGPADMEELDENLTDAERANIATSSSPLQRKLKSRHLQMIAIGGSIGTGLFIGSGSSLNSGGPAALIIGFGIIGIMLYCTMQSLGELAVAFPVSGAFAVFNSRFIDPSWGFAIGWNYAVQWLVVLPLELVAASITIDYWQSDINHAAWVAIFWVVVVVINLFGVRGYGEAEFVFSIIKIIAVVGFIILGIIINCGGIPTSDVGYIGGKFWQNPGAFANGFKGVCSVFVNAAFAFTGTELAGLAAAETANPRKTLPSACKQVFWRITLFYMISLTLVGLIVPYNNPNLLGASSVDVKASPFVIAIFEANIKVLPSIINAVILIAVLSVGNSAIFGCSRTLASLSHQGMAPHFLGYIDRAGRPLWAIIATSIFGLLCFLAASDKEAEVFNWLMALTGLSLIFTWGSTNLAHIRFRRALRIQGRTTAELPFVSQCGTWGSWIGFGINVLVLIAQFYVAAFPIDAPSSPGARASDFFQKYLAAPIVLLFFFVHKLWKRTKVQRCATMDLDSGRRDVDIDLLQQELAEEKQYIASRPWWYRTWKWWC